MSDNFDQDKDIDVGRALAASRPYMTPEQVEQSGYNEAAAQTVHTRRADSGDEYNYEPYNVRDARRDVGRSIRDVGTSLGGAAAYTSDYMAAADAGFGDYLQQGLSSGIQAVGSIAKALAVTPVLAGDLQNMMINETIREQTGQRGMLPENMAGAFGAAFDEYLLDPLDELISPDSFLREQRARDAEAVEMERLRNEKADRVRKSNGELVATLGKIGDEISDWAEGISESPSTLWRGGVQSAVEFGAQMLTGGPVRAGVGLGVERIASKVAGETAKRAAARKIAEDSKHAFVKKIGAEKELRKYDDYMKSPEAAQRVARGGADELENISNEWLRRKQAVDYYDRLYRRGKRRDSIANSAYIALTEAGSNIGESTKEVNEISHEDLMKNSPLYRKTYKDYLDSGYSKEDAEYHARDILAASEEHTALPWNAGSAVFAAPLADRAVRRVPTALGIVRSGLEETAEETITTVGQTIGQNRARKEHNPDQDTFEGVGTGIAETATNTMLGTLGLQSSRYAGRAVGAGAKAVGSAILNYGEDRENKTIAQEKAEGKSAEQILSGANPNTVKTPLLPNNSNNTGTGTGGNPPPSAAPTPASPTGTSSSGSAQELTPEAQKIRSRLDTIDAARRSIDKRQASGKIDADTAAREIAKTSEERNRLQRQWDELEKANKLYKSNNNNKGNGPEPGEAGTGNGGGNGPTPGNPPGAAPSGQPGTDNGNDNGNHPPGFVTEKMARARAAKERTPDEINQSSGPDEEVADSSFLDNTVKDANGDTEADRYAKKQKDYIFGQGDDYETFNGGFKNFNSMSREEIKSLKTLIRAAKRGEIKFESKDPNQKAPSNKEFLEMAQQEAVEFLKVMNRARARYRNVRDRNRADVTKFESFEAAGDYKRAERVAQELLDSIKTDDESLKTSAASRAKFAAQASFGALSAGTLNRVINNKEVFGKFSKEDQENLKKIKQLVDIVSTKTAEAITKEHLDDSGIGETSNNFYSEIKESKQDLKTIVGDIINAATNNDAVALNKALARLDWLVNIKTEKAKALNFGIEQKTDDSIAYDSVNSATGQYYQETTYAGSKEMYDHALAEQHNIAAIRDDIYRVVNKEFHDTYSNSDSNFKPTERIAKKSDAEWQEFAQATKNSGNLGKDKKARKTISIAQRMKIIEGRNKNGTSSGNGPSGNMGNNSGNNGTSNNIAKLRDDIRRLQDELNKIVNSDIKSEIRTKFAEPKTIEQMQTLVTDLQRAVDLLSSSKNPEDQKLLAYYRRSLEDWKKTLNEAVRERDYNAKVKKIQDEIDSINNTYIKAQQDYEAGKITYAEFQKAENDYFNNGQNRIDELRQELNKLSFEFNNPGQKYDDLGYAEARKLYNEAMAKLTADFNERANNLRKDVLDKKITEEEYKKKLDALQKERLAAQDALVKKYLFLQPNGRYFTGEENTKKTPAERAQEILNRTNAYLDTVISSFLNNLDTKEKQDYYTKEAGDLISDLKAQIQSLYKDFNDGKLTLQQFQNRLEDEINKFNDELKAVQDKALTYTTKKKKKKGKGPQDTGIPGVTITSQEDEIARLNAQETDMSLDDTKELVKRLDELTPSEDTAEVAEARDTDEVTLSDGTVIHADPVQKYKKLEKQMVNHAKKLNNGTLSPDQKRFNFNVILNDLRSLIFHKRPLDSLSDVQKMSGQQLLANILNSAPLFGPHATATASQDIDAIKKIFIAYVRHMNHYANESTFKKAYDDGTLFEDNDSITDWMMWLHGHPQEAKALLLAQMDSSGNLYFDLKTQVAGCIALLIALNKNISQTKEMTPSQLERTLERLNIPREEYYRLSAEEQLKFKQAVFPEQLLEDFARTFSDLTGIRADFLISKSYDGEMMLNALASQAFTFAQKQRWISNQTITFMKRNEDKVTSTKSNGQTYVPDYILDKTVNVVVFNPQSREILKEKVHNKDSSISMTNGNLDVGSFLLLNQYKTLLTDQLPVESRDEFYLDDDMPDVKQANKLHDKSKYKDDQRTAKEEMRKGKYYINPRFVNVLTTLGIDGILSFMGLNRDFTTPEEIANWNYQDLASAKGKQQSIISGYNIAMSRLEKLLSLGRQKLYQIAVDKGLDVDHMTEDEWHQLAVDYHLTNEELYMRFDYEMTASGRWQETSPLGPQQDKLNRQAFSQVKWRIKLQGVLSEQDRATQIGFKLAVLQGLGKKLTKYSDDNYNGEVNRDFQKVLDIAKAHRGWATIKDPEVMHKEISNIYEELRREGFDGFSFLGLNVILNMDLYAQGKDFDCTIYLEHDGSTNGFVNSIFKFSAGEGFSQEEIKSLLRGSIFPGLKLSKYKYKQMDKDDNYEGAASKASQNITDYFEGRSNEGQIDQPVALNSANLLTQASIMIKSFKNDGLSHPFTGEFEVNTTADDEGNISIIAKIARAIVKTPVTAVNYGQGLLSNARSLFSNIIETPFLMKLSHAVQTELKPDDHGWTPETPGQLFYAKELRQERKKLEKLRDKKKITQDAYLKLCNEALNRAERNFRSFLTTLDTFATHKQVKVIGKDGKTVSIWVPMYEKKEVWSKRTQSYIVPPEKRRGSKAAPYMSWFYSGNKSLADKFRGFTFHNVGYGRDGMGNFMANWRKSFADHIYNAVHENRGSGVEKTMNMINIAANLKGYVLNAYERRFAQEILEKTGRNPSVRELEQFRRDHPKLYREYRGDKNIKVQSNLTLTDTEDTRLGTGAYDSQGNPIEVRGTAAQLNKGNSDFSRLRPLRYHPSLHFTKNPGVRALALMVQALGDGAMQTYFYSHKDYFLKKYGPEGLTEEIFYQVANRYDGFEHNPAITKVIAKMVNEAAWSVINENPMEAVYAMWAEFKEGLSDVPASVLNEARSAILADTPLKETLDEYGISLSGELRAENQKETEAAKQEDTILSGTTRTVESWLKETRDEIDAKHKIFLEKVKTVVCHMSVDEQGFTSDKGVMLFTEEELDNIKDINDLLPLLQQKLNAVLEAMVQPGTNVNEETIEKADKTEENKMPLNMDNDLLSQVKKTNQENRNKYTQRPNPNRSAAVNNRANNDDDDLDYYDQLISGQPDNTANNDLDYYDQLAQQESVLVTNNGRKTTNSPYNNRVYTRSTEVDRFNQKEGTFHWSTFFKDTIKRAAQALAEKKGFEHPIGLNKNQSVQYAVGFIQRFISNNVQGDYKIVVCTPQYFREVLNAGTTNSKGVPDALTDHVNHVIYINGSLAENAQEVMLYHELIHAATSVKIGYLLDTPIRELKSQQEIAAKYALDELIDLYEYAINDLDLDTITDSGTRQALQYLRNQLRNYNQDKYTQLCEFIAYTLSDPVYLQTMNNLKADLKRQRQSVIKNIYDGVRKAVKKIFGLKDDQELDFYSSILRQLYMNVAVITEANFPGLKEDEEFSGQNTGAQAAIKQSFGGRTVDTDELVKRINEIDSLFKDTGIYQTVAKDSFTRSEAELEVLTKDLDTALTQAQSAGLINAGPEMITARHIAAAFNFNLGADKSTIKLEAESLRRAIVDKLSPRDFEEFPGDPNGQFRYDVLTNLEQHVDKNNKSLALPIFMALSYTSPRIRQVLANKDIEAADRHIIGMSTNQVNRSKLDEAIYDLFERGVNGIADLVNPTYKKNTNAQDEVDRYVTDIAAETQRNSLWTKPAEMLSKVDDGAANLITKGADKLIGSGFLTNVLEPSKVPGARGALNTIKAGLGYTIGYFSSDSARINEEIHKAAAQSMANSDGKPGLVHFFSSLAGDLVRELLEADNYADTIQTFEKKMKSLVQQARTDFRKQVPNEITTMFNNEGADLNDNNRRAMNNVLLKCDLGCLSNEEIALVLKGDGNNLEAQKRHYEAEIAKSLMSTDDRSLDFVLTKSQQLAEYITTGKLHPMLLRNAKAIVAGARINKKDVLSEGLVDRYITLLALKNLFAEDMRQVRELYKKAPKAFNYCLGQQRQLTADENEKAMNSTTRGFNSTKGYYPKTPTVEGNLIAVKRADRKKYEAMGYRYIKDSEFLPNAIYMSCTLNPRPAFTQGALQTVIHCAGGADVVTGYSRDPVITRVGARSQAAKNLLLRKGTSSEALTPVFDSSGNVVTYEVLMDTQLAGNVYQYEQDFAQNLGNWMGRQFEESAAENWNIEMIHKLARIYREDQRKHNTKGYVNVETSPDPVIRDAVKLFNPVLREVIKKDFPEGLMIRRDMLEDVIGHRKASVTDMWTGNTRWSPETQRKFVDLTTKLLGKNAMSYLLRAENIMQGLTAMARNRIVIVSGAVLAANCIGNFKQLMSAGVPLVEMGRRLPTILRELERYNRDRIRVVQLTMQRNSEMGSKEPGYSARAARYDEQIAAIKASWSQMMIGPLLAAGEYSTIADIGDQGQDIKLSLGRAGEVIQEGWDKTPDTLREVMRHGFIMKGTPVYNALEKATQYSDFAAKVLLYTHLIEHGTSHQDALKQCRYEFVNYDMIPGRSREYIENFGFAWFFNYKLRSFRVAVGMMKNHPARALLSGVGLLPPLVEEGTPLTDNIVGSVLQGKLPYSLGPGMLIDFPTQNLWYNMFK